MLANWQMRLKRIQRDYILRKKSNYNKNSVLQNPKYHLRAELQQKGKVLD